VTRQAPAFGAAGERDAGDEGNMAMGLTTMNGHGGKQDDQGEAVELPRLLPELVKPCPKCEGSAEKWDCGCCHGTGKVLTPAGEQVAEVVRLIVILGIFPDKPRV